jgi:hypothetical protein
VDGAWIYHQNSRLTCSYSLHRLCVEEKLAGVTLSHLARVIHTPDPRSSFPGPLSEVAQILPRRPGSERQEPAIVICCKTARGVSRSGYDSIMCSTAKRRLAEIGQAIDDLAAQAGAGAAGAAGTGASTSPARGHKGADADEVMKRLADLWAKLAQLDPEVARRLPTYEA